MPAGAKTIAEARQLGPYGHGTHVAGLVTLAAPEAKIMPLRVLDPQGVGNMWVLAEAVRYAVDPDGDPSTHDGADVINLSLATVHDSNLLREVIGDACDSNKPSLYPKVVVVAAAGNRGQTEPRREMFPAAENFEGELSVAASGRDDKLAGFSQRDDRVDLMAPGVGLTSSVPGEGTGVWSGTSMSSPLVAGVAALVRAAAPALDADGVKEQINETAFDTRDLGDKDVPVRDRIDAARAVASLAAGTPNPNDDARNFVRQHYLDFFNRAARPLGRGLLDERDRKVRRGEGLHRLPARQHFGRLLRLHRVPRHRLLRLPPAQGRLRRPRGQTRPRALRKLHARHAAHRRERRRQLRRLGAEARR